MNRSEHLKKFVKENALKLTSTNSTRDSVRILVKQYGDKHNLRSSERFNLNEVLEEVLKLILQKETESQEEFVSQVDKVPFLSEKLTLEKIKTFYNTNSTPAESILRAEDLSKLGKDEFIKSLEEKYEKIATEKARKKVAIELDDLDRKKKEFEKERKDFEKFRSELDTIPENISVDELIEKFPVKVETESVENPVEWWEEAGLTGDPFPSNLGLTGIPTEKYDEIVVETPFIKDYIRKMGQSPKTLIGKIILLLGEYGSGKTTLFQYLSHKISAGRVLPINVVLNPAPRIVDLTASTLQQIYSIAAETHKVRIGVDPRRERMGLDPMLELAEILTSLTKEDVTEGFVILLDGLHKGTSYSEQIFEFLQQVQNIQEFLSGRSIEIGFIIAGSNRWKNEIQGTASLSGSFYTIDTILPISENYAVQAFKKRMKSFVSEVSDEPVIKDDSSLIDAFRLLQKRFAREITFRDFLDYVRVHLSARNYKELGVEVALHLEIVSDVHSILNSSIVGRNYSRIWVELYKRPFLKAHCKKVMQIANKHGISEHTALFKDYKAAFFLLRRFGFLYQVRVEGDEAFRWYPSSECIFAISQVCKALYISPNRAFSAAFEEESSVMESESLNLYAGVIRVLNEVINAWRDTFPKISERLMSVRSTVDMIGNVVSRGDFMLLQPDHISGSTKGLIEAIMKFIFGEDVSDVGLLEHFSNSWVYPENGDSIEHYALWEDPLPTQQTPLYGMLQQHSQVLSDLLNILIDLIRGESVSRLLNRELSFSDMQELHELRRLFLGQSYAEVADKSTALLEGRIRETIFPILRTIWGENAKDTLPEDLVKEVNNAESRGNPILVKSSHPNFLYDLSRSEYSKALFGGDIYKATLGRVIKNKQEKERIKETLEVAFSINDRVAHRDEASYFADNAVNIGSTLSFLSEFLELLTNLTKKLLESPDIHIETTESGSVRLITSSYKSEVPLSRKPRPLTLTQHDAENHSYRILKTLSEREIYVNTLSDVCILSSNPPEHSISLLKHLINKGFVELEHSKFYPIILCLSKSGSDFLIKNTLQK